MQPPIADFGAAVEFPDLKEDGSAAIGCLDNKQRSRAEAQVIVLMRQVTDGEKGNGDARFKAILENR